MNRRSNLPRYDDAPEPNADCGACLGCPDAAEPVGRRGFLRYSLIAAGALAAFGLNADSAAALPIRLVSGSRLADGARRYPLPAADGVQIDRDAQVILVRWQDAAYAFALSCPHQNTALRWLERDGRFQCPKHGSRYRPDGTFIEGRATRSMDRYAVRRDGAELVVELDTLYKQDADPAGWNAAVVRLA
ncbi:MAG TPA: Rieske (2Fe-2S) protein [Gemmatimonadaceae bacterium]|nr:Rieske (2Fe-2S) protein [Gemmatimonadaceae bacterium]